MSILKDSKKGGIPSASLAALARTAAGTPWPGVLAAGVGAALLGKLPTGKVSPRWLRVIQALWASFFLSQTITWAGEGWPGDTNRAWIGLILLALAYWLARKGREAVSAACSVLGILEAGLLGGVLLGSLREIQIENLRPEGWLPNGWLLALLLLPGEKRGSAWLWAVPFSLVSAGVGCRGETAFLEMSRCVSGFGAVRRLESLAAVGLALGFFRLAAELLSGQDGNDRGLSAVLAAGLFLGGFQLNGWAAAAAAIFVWRILPALCGKRMTKEDKI